VDDAAVTLPSAAPAGTPGPLERVFDRIPLPPDALEIVAVDGRDERDVWLLGRAGWDVALFHWDGAQLVKEKPPQCKAQVEFRGLVLAPDAVIVLATSFEEEGGVPYEVRHAKGGGGWSCERRSESQRLWLGAELLRLEVSYRLTLAGHLLPLPASGLPNAEIAARSPADLWLYAPSSSDIFHGNGVGWESRPTGLAKIRSLRTDDSGAAWLVGGDESSWVEGNVVLRWDTAAHAWKRLPTPADLRAERIRVSSERNVWMLGKEHIHHWDGTSLRRGKTPMKRLQGAWMSPTGELWIVGGDESGAAESRKVAGVAFRVPAARKP
jgi:hypothetical protein